MVVKPEPGDERGRKWKGWTKEGRVIDETAGWTKRKKDTISLLILN